MTFQGKKWNFLKFYVIFFLSNFILKLNYFENKFKKVQNCIEILVHIESGVTSFSDKPQKDRRKKVEGSKESCKCTSCHMKILIKEDSKNSVE